MWTLLIPQLTWYLFWNYCKPSLLFENQQKFSTEILLTTTGWQMKLYISLCHGDWCTLGRTEKQVTGRTTTPTLPGSFHSEPPVSLVCRVTTDSPQDDIRDIFTGPFQPKIQRGIYQSLQLSTVLKYINYTNDYIWNLFSDSTPTRFQHSWFSPIPKLIQHLTLTYLSFSASAAIGHYFSQTWWN